MSPMSWKFHPVSQFAHHANAWDTLQRATTHTPFFDSAFIAPLIDNFGQGNEQAAFHHGPDGVLVVVRCRVSHKSAWSANSETG